MSVATTAEQLACEWCDSPRERTDHAGPYCSDRCSIRHRGAKILNQIESHHTVCSTCYGLVKTTLPAKPVYVEGPDHPGREDKGPKDVSDGFQFPTDRTTWGVDTFSNHSGHVLDPSERRYRELEGTRWSCVCGAVNPNDTHGIIQAMVYGEAFKNLYRALEDAHRRGAIPNAPTFEPYRKAFLAPWRGAEYAVGKAVYGDS